MGFDINFSYSSLFFSCSFFYSYLAMAFFFIVEFGFGRFWRPCMFESSNWLADCSDLKAEFVVRERLVSLGKVSLVVSVAADSGRQPLRMRLWDIWKLQLLWVFHHLDCIAAELVDVKQCTIAQTRAGLSYIMTSPKNNPERVTQLQCQQLDKQFQSTFHGFSLEALKYYPSLANSIKHELQLILNYLYFRLTVAKDEPEPGNYLQNIIYCAKGKGPLSKLQKLGLLLLSVVLPYVKGKIQAKVKNQKIKKLLYAVDSFLRIFDYINLVLFIKDGVYRSITHRVLKIQMKFIDPTRSRILDFSLMNRQLLWSVYENFISSVLPFVKNLLNTHLKKIFYLYSYIDVDAVDKSCMVCGQSQVTLPQANDACPHLACYYCISTLTNGKMQGKCRSCSKMFNRWMPAVAEKVQK